MSDFFFLPQVKDQPYHSGKNMRLFSSELRLQTLIFLLCSGVCKLFFICAKCIDIFATMVGGGRERSYHGVFNLFCLSPQERTNLLMIVTFF